MEFEKKIFFFLVILSVFLETKKPYQQETLRIIEAQSCRGFKYVRMYVPTYLVLNFPVFS